MKNKLFISTILILLFTPALAAGQTLADYCHVYLIDTKLAEEALRKYPTGNAEQDARLLASGVTIVGQIPGYNAFKHNTKGIE
jgi:hypothetical protein